MMRFFGGFNYCVLRNIVKQQNLIYERVQTDKCRRYELPNEDLEMSTAKFLSDTTRNLMLPSKSPFIFGFNDK